jgi:hypothetical protein
MFIIPRLSELSPEFSLGVLPAVISAVMEIICLPSHRNFIHQLIILEYHAFTLLIQGHIDPTRIAEQVIGLILEKYPVVSSAELQEIILPMLQEMPLDEFESRIVALVSLTNRTTVAEVMIHLTNQKIKSILFSEFA